MTRQVERLILPTNQLKEILAHLRAVYPNEGCGLLAIGLDDERVVQRFPISNIATEPQRHFLGEPLELLDALLTIERAGQRLGAIYHSHPHSPAWPSAEDVRQAYYPSALSLIVSLAQHDEPVVRLFAIREGQINEQPLTIE